ncbi:MAG: hypothetical protein ACYDGM_00700 [Vulcanimicrobiaceae bacterium]
MRIFRFLPIVAFVLALVGLSFPAYVVRAAQAPPVVLNSCNLIYSDTQSIASQIVGLDAQFTNDSSKTATIVNIGTSINGQTSVIRDVGSFAPGIEIHHRYKAGGGQFALPSVLRQLFGHPAVQCSIVSVTFEDGSTWPGNAPNAALASSAIVTQPTTLQLRGAGPANARLALATSANQVSSNSDCGGIATVEVVASTASDLALRITPRKAGTCTITLRDGNGNTATIPVNVVP